MDITKIDMGELSSAWGSIDSNEYYLFFDDEEKFEQYCSKGQKFWGIDACLLDYLTSDHTYRSPRVDYYVDRDSDGLVIISDGDPFFTDESWEGAICESLGSHHPERVIALLKEKSGEFDSTLDYVLIKGAYHLPINYEDEWEYLEGPTEEPCLDDIYKKIEEHFVAWVPSDNNHQGEVYIGMAKNRETSELVNYRREYSYWQGSSDYDARFITEDQYNDFLTQ